MLIFENMVDHIQLEQLEILGFARENILVMSILFVLFIIFICCRLIVALFRIKASPLGFTFILSSLFILSASAIYIIVHGEFTMLKVVFQATFLFGLLLSIFIISLLLINKNNNI